MDDEVLYKRMRRGNQSAFATLNKRVDRSSRQDRVSAAVRVDRRTPP